MQLAERNAKAAKLVENWEKRGRKFNDEAERTTEIERLAGLEDSAKEVTKSVIDSLLEAKSDENDPDKDKGKKVLHSNAGTDRLSPIQQPISVKLMKVIYQLHVYQ